VKILVIHGPNLNMLGKREPGIYGSATLDDIDASLRNVADELGADLDIMQSNLEGAILSAIQEAPTSRVDGILINPGAYGHTSIALRDALLSANLPFVEVHISNTYAREEFRHRSYISDISSGIIIGFGPVGYLHGLRALLQLLNVRHVATQSESAP
jgi:3-dehydroquinate dehydratase II